MPGSEHNAPVPKSQRSRTQDTAPKPPAQSCKTTGKSSEKHKTLHSPLPIDAKPIANACLTRSHLFRLTQSRTSVRWATAPPRAGLVLSHCSCVRTAPTAPCLLSSGRILMSQTGARAQRNTTQKHPVQSHRESRRPPRKRTPSLSRDWCQAKEKKEKEEEESCATGEEDIRRGQARRTGCVSRVRRGDAKERRGEGESPSKPRR